LGSPSTCSVFSFPVNELGAETIPIDEVATSNAHGNQFVRFSVDERLAWDEDGSWNEDATPPGPQSERTTHMRDFVMQPRAAREQHIA
jgi:hypothetical protein